VNPEDKRFSTIVVGNWQNSIGIAPIKLFALRSSFSKSLIFPRLGGTVPVRLLEATDSIVKAERDPRESGKDPPSLLMDKSSHARFVSSPIWLGIVLAT